MIKKISGKIIDVVSKQIYKGIISIENDKITQIEKTKNVDNQYILPGLIDAHVHIESSMLIPTEFARMALPHGTIATVSDPHEIANVCGKTGIQFMIQNGKESPMKFFFGVPSCVPATIFETSGNTISTKDVNELLANNEILYLAEMMNFPGVIYKDPNVMSKIQLAHKYNKPIDGHAPGLSGKDLKKYVAAGISTDHECFTYDEALEKINLGMKILIREGSAAKNFEALIPILKEYPNMTMFCSDDKHPDELEKGHINTLIKKALNIGLNPIDVIRAATYNPVNHYNLPIGLLQKNDTADFVIIDNLKSFNVKSTYIRGNKVAENGVSFAKKIPSKPINFFNTNIVSKNELQFVTDKDTVNIIQAIDGQLITKKLELPYPFAENNSEFDIKNDILKIVVKNRYAASKPAIGFIKGFGLKQGAIASTVAHDSHNLIAVGTSDTEIQTAMNKLIHTKGGIVVVNNGITNILPLPYAGLMTDEDGKTVSKQYQQLDAIVKKLGSKLQAPFMTLSFMALLVIPEIKLSDKGLFDGNKFDFF